MRWVRRKEAAPGSRPAGAGRTGSPKGCQHLQRVGGDARWVCQCTNSTAGQRLPDQARLSGRVLRPKDDVLFEIDPRPFQAVLDQAKAQLAQADAQFGNATLNVNRDIPEAEANAIARSQLEGDTQAQLAAKATVAAGRAAVEQAALNLNFTKVRSLISGIAGIAQVQVGNLVTPSAVLTGVSQVDPIKTYFPISGEDYLRIADKIHPETVNLLSSDSPIPLQLILANGNTYARSGGILFADRQVDQQTGTIRI